MRSKGHIAIASLIVAILFLCGVAAFADPIQTPSVASAGAAVSTLEKIRAQGFVECGSASRPGLATVDSKNNWSGLEVEICRAVATAVFGPNARYAYHKYESDRDYDTARTGGDQISFLSFAEMLEQRLTDKLLPGPTVFIESHDLLVAQDSPVKHPLDLAGAGICFMISSAADHSLAAWYRERNIDFIPNAYQEEGELYDTYNVQRCQAIVDESTALANARLDGGVNNLKSRFLPDHLDSFPIVAATPLKADAQWAAIVSWTIYTLLNADAHETTYRPNGLRAMAISGDGLGFAKDWQSAVINRVGSYSAIFRRTLGADSPLKLDQGLNKRLLEGGAFLAPFKD